MERLEAHLTPTAASPSLQNLCPCLSLSFLRRSRAQSRRSAPEWRKLASGPQRPALCRHLVSAAHGAWLCLPDKVEEMTHAQKASPIDMKIATIKPRPSSRCLVTAADMNVSRPPRVFLMDEDGRVKPCVFLLHSPCSMTAREWPWCPPPCRAPTWAYLRREQ